MTVNIVVFPKPCVHLSLVEGGDLEENQTYYFVPVFMRGSGYYGNSCSPSGDEVSITTTTTKKSIKAEWFQKKGVIELIEYHDDTYVLITSNAHGLSDGEEIFIRTGLYVGDYIVYDSQPNSFKIQVNYIGDDESNPNWYADKGLPKYAQQIVFKWDRYSLINPSTGKPYPWNNLNDPAITDEWAGSRGHYKWTTTYYENKKITGSENTWNKIATTLTYSRYELHGEGSFEYHRYNCGIDIPDLAFNIPAYPSMPFPTDKGSLCIIFDEDGGDQYDLMAALTGSVHSDLLFISNEFKTRAKGDYNIQVFGSMYSLANNSSVVLNDMNMVFIGGKYFYSSYSNRAVLNRCIFTTIATSQSSWHNPKVDANDTKLIHNGNAFILDNVIGNNFEPKMNGFGSMTFYGDITGIKAVGGNLGSYDIIQWRYYKSNTPITDLFLKDFYLSATLSAGDPVVNVDWTNVDFRNEGLQKYEVMYMLGYMAGKDIDHVINCYNVTTNRPDGKVISRYASTHVPNSLSHIMKFYYNNSFKLLDTNGDPIVGAEITLIDKNGVEYTGITNSLGKSTLVTINYTSEYDASDSDGRGNFTNTQELNPFTLKIEKEGYLNIHTSLNLGTISHDWEMQMIKPIYYQKQIIGSVLGINITGSVE